MNGLLGVIGAAVDAIKVIALESFDVCQSIKSLTNYRVVLQNNNAQLTLEEILAICQSE